jgi:hypothetical protein
MGPDERREPPAPWSPAEEEPEPEWVEAIRQGRKARGDRLRHVFETLADDDPHPGSSGAADDGRPTEDRTR